MGATERVAARLIAVRMPEAMVNARRSVAKKNAQTKGAPPSQAPLTLMAWHLFLPHVPPPIGPTATSGHGDPLRGHRERRLQSWKSDLHCASLTTKKAAPT
jgi:hypothetical protein